MDEDKDQIFAIKEKVGNLRLENGLLKKAIDSIYTRVRADQTRKSPIEKLLTLDEIKKTCSEVILELAKYKS